MSATAAPTKKQTGPLNRPLYLYDLPGEVLESLTFTSAAECPALPDTDVISTPKTESSSQSHDSGAGVVVGSQSCSLCTMSFATVEDQRSHLRSDWHHYNLKLKLRGQQAVSEPEFEKLIADLDESLSGSDDSESDDASSDDPARSKDSTLVALLKKQATLADKTGSDRGMEDDEQDGPRRQQRGGGNPPLVWLSSSLLPDNTFFGVYKALFTNEELAKEGSAFIDNIRKRQLEPISMPKPPKEGAVAPAAHTGSHVFLCMIGGGHFAAMVVSLAPKKSKSSNPVNREATILAHKTFHRYTTRRKQGGSQSANDNAKGTAHSAGSSLRRYNEQALVEDVRSLLAGWKGLLDTADLLFVRATGATNRRTLFGPYDGQVLRPGDKRLRGFPFSTRRATRDELMRSFVELTRLKIREIAPEPAAPPTQAQSATAAPQPPARPKLSEEEETAQLHTTQIQALIRRSKLPALLTYLKTNSLSPDFRFQPEDTQQNRHAPTPLHLAAAQGAAVVVTGLLCSAERRRAEEERLKKEGPKVSAASRGGKGRTAAEENKSAQEKREEEMRGMTPEQRMRIERERRARAAEERLRKMQAPR
ncbi:ankyrin repeat-containing protein [Magnaporthiopsis poae ATCC 64411]|uniref:Ankyrin repeat-containing protein n=1 Tax=Magnaporthiopsis poae (strain ATCC 64411 / 73-15) TaxID=644358 RepID=A0A0C4DRG2_MAGP6|nr:ankyrin repeat-containing protein [Magnaporthiopsis poae ATCC 64411]